MRPVPFSPYPLPVAKEGNQINSTAHATSGLLVALWQRQARRSFVFVFSFTFFFLMHHCQEGTYLQRLGNEGKERGKERKKKRKGNGSKNKSLTTLEIAPVSKVCDCRLHLLVIPGGRLRAQDDSRCLASTSKGGGAPYSASACMQRQENSEFSCALVSLQLAYGCGVVYGSG